MLHRPQLLHQGGSCQASASCYSSRRGLVCYRPTRCTAISRQQLQVQCTGGPMDGSGSSPRKQSNDQKGAPSSLPKDPKPPANTGWQTSKHASSPTGPGSTPKPLVGARNTPTNPNTTTTTTVTTTTSGAANTGSQAQPSTPANPGSPAQTGPNPPKPTPGASSGPPAPSSPGMGTTGMQSSSAQSNTTTTTTTTTTVTTTTSTAPTSSTSTVLSPTQPPNKPVHIPTGLVDWASLEANNRRPPRYGDRNNQQSASGGLPTASGSSQKQPKIPQGPPPAAPKPEGRTRKGLGEHYDLDKTSFETAKFMQRGINTITRLPLAALLCSDPTTVRQFLMLFPVFMHDSLGFVRKDDAAPTQLAVACVVAADPANVPVRAMSGQTRYMLCSAPWTVNYFIGAPGGVTFEPEALGASKKQDDSSNYAWVAQTKIAARCLQVLGDPVSESQLKAGVKNDTLVLDAYALEAPDPKLPLAKQARLAVIPTVDVVCWGLLKGQTTDKLLVAVVGATVPDHAWRLEDVIKSTKTVQLKCGNDVVTLDPNRDTCVLGPRSYITAQPQNSNNQEKLALVGVWHDAGPSTGLGGWHLYAQIKRYGWLPSQPTVLIGATQLYPLGPRANKYQSGPATSLLQALKVPAGEESYRVAEAGAFDKSTDIQDYPRFAAFGASLAAYQAAVGNQHKVTDVQDASQGSKDIKNVYTNLLTQESPEFRKD